MIRLRRLAVTAALIGAALAASANAACAATAIEYGLRAC